MKLVLSLKNRVDEDDLQIAALRTIAQQTANIPGDVIDEMVVRIRAQVESDLVKEGEAAENAALLRWLRN